MDPVRESMLCVMVLRKPSFEGQLAVLLLRLFPAMIHRMAYDFFGTLKWMTRPWGVLTEEQIAFLGSTGILRKTGTLRLGLRGNEGETRREVGLLWEAPGEVSAVIMPGALTMRKPMSSSSVSSSPSTANC